MCVCAQGFFGQLCVWAFVIRGDARKLVNGRQFSLCVSRLSVLSIASWDLVQPYVARPKEVQIHVQNAWS